MNALMTRLSPSATRMIRLDHTHVMALFHKLEPSLARSQRDAIVRNICTALEIHAQLEEEIFYPALRAAGVDSPQLERSKPEHDEMRDAIQRVRAATQPPAQMRAMHELMKGVIHHVAEEETELLPLAETRMASQLDALGARMTERRLQLAKPHMGQMAVDLARGAPAKTGALMATGALVAVGALLLGRRRHHAIGYGPYGRD
jgi:hemerythrin superfamily protein